MPSKLRTIISTTGLFLILMTLQYTLVLKGSILNGFSSSGINDNFFWTSFQFLVALLILLILITIIVRLYITKLKKALINEKPSNPIYPLTNCPFGEKSDVMKHDNDIGFKPFDSNYILKCIEKIGKVGYWNFDCINEILYFSDTIYDLLNKNKETPILLFADFIDLVDLKERNNVTDLFYGRHNDELEHAVDFTITCKDSHTRHYHLIATYKKNKVGEAKLIEGVMALKIEHEKNKHEFKLDIKTNLESNIAGVSLISPTGLVQRFNRRAKEIFETYDKWPCAFNTNLIQTAIKYNDQQFLKYFERASKGEEVEYDKFYPGPDGAGRWVNYALTPVRQRSALIGVCITSRDITVTKNYLHMIIEQNSALLEIAWMQSHLLRAPLARIMGLIELITLELKLDDDNHLLFDYLMDASKEMDSIIKRISTYTDNIICVVVTK